MIQRTLFFIKPPHSYMLALDTLIHELLLEKKLQIRHKSYVVFNDDLINQIYHSTAESFVIKLREHLRDKACPVYVVDGVNAMDTVVSMIGDRLPVDCAPDSLRYKYGDHSCRNSLHDVADHCRTKEQVDKCLRAFNLTHLILPYER